MKLLERASLIDPQTVGVVERSHNALKLILKWNTIELWNDWFNYVQPATFFHKTCLSVSDCGPTVVFHVREPLKPLDLRFSNTLIERFSPRSEVSPKNFSHNKMELTRNFLERSSNLLYKEYRASYDSKAEAKRLSLSLLSSVYS